MDALLPLDPVAGEHRQYRLHGRPAAPVPLGITGAGDLGQGVRAGMGLRHLAIGLGDGGQGLRTRLSHRGRPAGVGEEIGPAQAEGPVQVVETAHVVVERGGPHAELGGEPRHGERLHPVHVDHPGGRVHHPVRREPHARHQTSEFAKRSTAPATRSGCSTWG